MWGLGHKYTDLLNIGHNFLKLMVQTPLTPIPKYKWSLHYQKMFSKCTAVGITFPTRIKQVTVDHCSSFNKKISNKLKVTFSLKALKNYGLTSRDELTLPR